jgi:ketosteroid isomerase-like protein
MTSNSVRAAVLVEALHAGIRGDEATITRLCTEDVKAWTPARSASSLAELLVEIRRRDDSFSEVELEVSPLDVGGDFASAEWRVSMSHTGDLMLRDGMVVGATGQRVTLNGATVAEFEGERICAVRQYWDELAVFEQLGLLEVEEG